MCFGRWHWYLHHSSLSLSLILSHYNELNISYVLTVLATMYNVTKDLKQLGQAIVDWSYEQKQSFLPVKLIFSNIFITVIDITGNWYQEQGSCLPLHLMIWTETLGTEFQKEFGKLRRSIWDQSYYNISGY